METFIPRIKSSKIYSYFVWVVQMFHQQTLHNIILWFLSARDSPTWSMWSLSNPKFCQTWRHPVLLNVTESLAWFEDKRVKVVDQYSVAKTSLVVHASSLQTDRAGVHPCTRLPADISLGKIKILRKFDHSLGRKDDSTFTFYHLWKWTLAKTETQRCLNPFTSRKECVEIGVVSWLQNAESLCLQSQSLLVNNFINWSWADPETYPSPSCCPTMEEEVMGGMRDHLWL